MKAIVRLLFLILPVLYISANNLISVEWKQTSDEDFYDGDITNTEIIGTGESASVKITRTAGWFSDDWINRKRIKIVNSTATLNDYQVYFSTADLGTDALIAAGKLHADYSDLRFADGDGHSFLNYWAYPSTANPQGFWVKVSTLSANSIPNIFMYYNNASTTSVSSFDNTMQKLSATFGDSDGRIERLWHFDENSGTEILTDSGLENWVIATDLTSWTEVSTDGTTRKVSEESGTIYSGSRSVKLEAIGNDMTTFYFSQSIGTPVNGQKYQYNFYVQYSSRTQGSIKVDIYDTVAANSTGEYQLIQSTVGWADQFYFASARFTGNGNSAEIRVYMQGETYGYAYVDVISVKECNVTAVDSSVNGSNGTINGASFTGSDGGEYDNISTDTARFTAGNSLQFDGIDDWVSVGNSPIDTSITGYSVSMWVNPSSHTVTTSIFSMGLGAADSGMILFTLTDNKFYAQMDVSAADKRKITFNISAIDEWSHLVVTYDKGTDTVVGYLNGTTFASAATGGLIGPNFGTNIHIGKRTAGNYYNGIIDEVAIYNVALSASEIKAHYERRKYANPEPVFSSIDEEENSSSVTATYYDEGTYSSASLDAGTDVYSTVYETLSWNPTSQPSATRVKFQIATSTGNYNWVFRGPDGKTDTYYTSAGTIWSGHDGERYIKYKTYFYTNDGSVSPEITDVSITYRLISSVVSSVVGSGQAGEINAGGAKLIIPANTIFRDIKYTITKTTEAVLSFISEPMSVIVCYDFQAHDVHTGAMIHNLEGPVTIELRVKSEDGVNVDNTYPILSLEDAPDKLTLAYWTGRDWTVIGGTVTVEGNTVVVSKKIVHFTKYGVAVKSMPLAGLKVAPNPFTPLGPDPSFSKICFTFPNEDEEVELRIYDIATRLVKEVSTAGVTSISWDGTNRHDEIAEDGVYIYQLKVGDKIIGKGIVVLAK